MTCQRGQTYPFDWNRALMIGECLAAENIRAGSRIDDKAAMWALLCDAIKTSAIAYPGPPRRGFPVKSTMPDAPDEVSQWQKIAAYLRGDLDEMPTDECRPPMPDAETITRCDHVLHVWHHAALIDKNMNERRNMRKAVYVKASGRPDRVVRAITGYTRDQIKHAKRRAMGDMLDFIALLTKHPK